MEEEKPSLSQLSESLFPDPPIQRDNYRKPENNNNNNKINLIIIKSNQHTLQE